MSSRSDPERTKGAAVVIWPVLVLAVIGAFGLVRLGVAELGTRDVSVPKAALPPLHEIVAEDLETASVTRADVEGSDWTAATDLIGRVTTASLAAGEPIAKDSVTKAKPTGYGDLVPLAFQAEGSTAGEVESGEWVRLDFAPTVDSAAVAPVSVRAVLISAEGSDKDGTDYVVALGETDRTAVLNVVERARLLISPSP